MITKEKLLRPLVRIGIISLLPDGTYRKPVYIAPMRKWKEWRDYVAMFGWFYTFSNKRCNPKVPGRLLPFRWGFGIAGLLEIGDRGSQSTIIFARKPQ
jgi:hypothetical protein